MSVTLWCHQRRRSGGHLATDHSVVKLSSRLFLSHYGPSGPIGMRTSSGVVPLLSMPFIKMQGDLGHFGKEEA